MSAPRGRAKDLPVEPERLRRQFPALTEDDLAAYVQVTRDVLGGGAERGKRMRALVARAHAAQDKRRGGGLLTEDELLAVRYLAAVEKMQGRVEPA